MPMGRARREKSTSQVDDDDDGGKYVCNHHWCVQTANPKMTWLCGIGFWCLLESLYLAPDGRGVPIPYPRPAGVVLSLLSAPRLIQLCVPKTTSMC